MSQEYGEMFFDHKWAVFFLFSSLLCQMLKIKFYQAFPSRYFLSLSVLEYVVVNF